MFFFIINLSMKAKVSIIGAGHVGATTAQLVLQAGIADVVLYDITEGVPQGKALDLAEAIPLWNVSASSRGTNNFEDTAGSDIVVITAGFPRKPGMSRDDLLAANADVVKNVVSGTSHYSPDCMYIVVTNPMDAMTYVAWKRSGLPGNRVVGMGGVLDSSRFRTFISMELAVSPEDIETMVLGGHGDLMVPMPSHTSVKGVPLTALLAGEKIAALIQRTKNGGAEIVSLLKTGSAFYAPAASVCQMVKAILLDEKRMLPCAAYLNGEYGVTDLFVGVPVILGENGVERIIELSLTEEEREQFRRSAQSVRTLVNKTLV
jgi:malate dehydrogenase